MDWFLIVFRVIHIASAIVWAGGAAFFFFYVEPTVNKLGPEAERFVNELFARKLPAYFAAASGLAVVGGIALYIRDAGGLTLWGGATGTVFTIGALAAILAFLGGNALIPTTAMRLQAVFGEVRTSGGPPTAEQGARIHALQERLRMIGAIDLVLIAIAILAMETAKYVRF